MKYKFSQNNSHSFNNQQLLSSHLFFVHNFEQNINNFQMLLVTSLHDVRGPLKTVSHESR